MDAAAFPIRVAEFRRIDGDVMLLTGNNELMIENLPFVRQLEHAR